MEINELPIEQTGLSARALNALHRNNIHTVGAMLDQTEDGLSQMRNLGSKTVSEIMAKIADFKMSLLNGKTAVSEETVTGPSEQAIKILETQEQTIDDLELLSTRAYNILKLNGLTKLYRLASMSWDDLMGITRMDSGLADEIVMQCRRFCQSLEAETQLEEENEQPRNLAELIADPQYHDAIHRFVRANDIVIEKSGLSNRAVNQLHNHGIRLMSDCVFIPAEEIAKFRNLGAQTVSEILLWRNEYFEHNGDRMIAFCTGDQESLLDEASIRELILNAYQEAGFGGFSLKEMREYLKLPETVTDETLKKCFGTLRAAGELEYVDFRCYRIYRKFTDYLNEQETTDERSRVIIQRRLNGETLEAISQSYDMTRERVRQIVSKEIRKIQKKYFSETGLSFFDEDYYRYLFENYVFDRKDAEQWLGIPSKVWNYMLMTDAKKGKQDLSAALEDARLDAGLRLKIKNYLNRNKIYVDGVWLEKRRSDIEEYVIRKFCRDEVSFDDFTYLYNHFLESQDIPYDEDIYYTDAVIRTRKNHLADADFLVWKYGEMLRYYDITGRDFAELMDDLNLNAYQNTEITTSVLMDKHPEIMEKYDIRDQYELHNLLKKIVPEGSYHDFHCRRTPNLRFGEFNRDEAILELLLEHAPISSNDFAELIHQEFGYQTSVILANYLTPFSEYLDHGVYNIEQKAMLAENMQTLKAALQGDFYFLDEVKDLYAKLVPDADLSEINSYNLKRMGFQVLARYILQNYSSLESFFRNLLTREEVADITAIRSRYSTVTMFSQVQLDLKRNYEILEFEPNQIICIQKLEKAGITKDNIRELCDQVYEHVTDGEWFTAKSLRESGFYSDLFDLGFSDWFYGNILSCDPRFSSGRMLSALFLVKGEVEMSIRALLTERIQEHRSIDIYDLMTELEQVYGCITNRHDLIYKVQGTEIYFDEILERFYANKELYYDEIDEAGGFA